MISRARSVLLVLPVLLWPLLVAFGPPTLVASDTGAVPIGGTQLGEIGAARPPAQAGRAALIMDLPWGRIVFERNHRERLASASLTKIMTAVLAIERGGLDQTVTIIPDDLVEGSSMGLRAGDTLTLEQLLWGILVPSGNDAAQALARTIGEGSVERFVDLMNRRAADLNLADTHFVNPHGLDDPDHYTSARDLAMLTRHALRYPLFAEIVATPEKTITASRSFMLRTTNPLLQRQVPGVAGVKTGTTDRAGQALITLVDRDGRQILIVVLGAADRAAATGRLIDYAYTRFAWVTPSPALQARLAAEAGGAPAWDAAVMVPAWREPYVNTSLALPAEAARP